MTLVKWFFLLGLGFLIYLTGYCNGANHGFDLGYLNKSTECK